MLANSFENNVIFIKAGEGMNGYVVGTIHTDAHLWEINAPVYGRVVCFHVK